MMITCVRSDVKCQQFQVSRLKITYIWPQIIFMIAKKNETFRLNSNFIARDLAMIRNDVRSVRDKRNNWLGLLVIKACCNSREINQ